MRWHLIILPSTTNNFRIKYEVISVANLSKWGSCPQSLHGEVNGVAVPNPYMVRSCGSCKFDEKVL